MIEPRAGGRWYERRRGRRARRVWGGVARLRARRSGCVLIWQLDAGLGLRPEPPRPSSRCASSRGRPTHPRVELEHRGLERVRRARGRGPRRRWTPRAAGTACWRLREDHELGARARSAAAPRPRARRRAPRARSRPSARPPRRGRPSARRPRGGPRRDRVVRVADDRERPCCARRASRSWPRCPADWPSATWRAKRLAALIAATAGSPHSGSTVTSIAAAGGLLERLDEVVRLAEHDGRVGAELDRAVQRPRGCGPRRRPGRRRAASRPARRPGRRCRWRRARARSRPRAASRSTRAPASRRARRSRARPRRRRRRRRARRRPRPGRAACARRARRAAAAGRRSRRAGRPSRATPSQPATHGSGGFGASGNTPAALRRSTGFRPAASTSAALVAVVAAGVVEVAQLGRGVVLAQDRGSHSLHGSRTARRRRTLDDGCRSPSRSGPM